MIPVAVPSLWLISLLLLSFGALIGVAVWSIALAVSTGARAMFRRHLKKSMAALAALAALATPPALLLHEGWRVQQDIVREQQARNITLAHTQWVDGISMPVGTLLRPLLPGEANSFEEAVFPSPTAVLGLPAIRLTRKLQRSAETRALRVESLSLTLARDTDVAGWRCSAAGPLEFRRGRTGDDLQFTSCTLAPAQSVSGVTLPVGAILRASHDGNGPSPIDRWIVTPRKGRTPWLLSIQGVSLRDPHLYLDEAHRLTGIGGGVLNEPLTWGALRYPAGTRAQTVPSAMRARYPGAWVFSPLIPTPHPGHPDIMPGFSVVQMPSGEVKAIMPNDQAGAIHFPDFIVR